MKTATTLLEISKILKLSPSTVSRALKNHPDIAPATREKVIALAEKLDYEPNLNAVGLRTSDSRELAVIVPNLSGFFYDSFISAVEEETRRIGFSLIILLSGDDPAVEIENLKICKQRRVGGVLICITPATTSMEHILRVQKLEIPVVFFDKIPSLENQNTVRVGDEEAATLAAQQLISKQKKHILSIFGDLKMSISSRRLNAYQEFFRQYNSESNLVIVYATSSAEAEQCVRNAFANEKKPDAIFCMSDEILIGVMKAIQVLKVRCPEEVGIISISNGFFPKLYSPEITYVETSGFKLGKLAFQRIMDYKNGVTDPIDQALKCEVVEGGSL